MGAVTGAFGIFPWAPARTRHLRRPLAHRNLGPPLAGQLRRVDILRLLFHSGFHVKRAFIGRSGFEVRSCPVEQGRRGFPSIARSSPVGTAGARRVSNRPISSSNPAPSCPSTMGADSNHNLSVGYPSLSVVSGCRRGRHENRFDDLSPKT